MAYLTYQRRGPRNRHAGHNPLAAPLMLFAGVAVIAAFYVSYVLWPRWPEAQVALDAPSLPIVVSGVNFNIEPAAIRVAIQRRPGTQEHVDLAYLWPSLVPPDPAAKPTVGAPVDPNGLTLRGFRDGTPYQGEELVFEQQAPEHFMARCSRKGAVNSGTCLLERRIGNADITFRFPRDWLSDWKPVAHGIDRLLARLHPAATQ
jgi:hypothetical protein